MPTDRITELLTELDEIARDRDSYEYGLPLHAYDSLEKLRAAVSRFLVAAGAEERRAREMVWTASLPGAGVYWMRSAWTGIVKVRLTYGGFRGDAPMAFDENSEPFTIPGDALWAEAPA